MGMIRETSTGRTSPLEPEHVFGRLGPPRCSQTLNDPHVSSVHAVLRWCGLGWELKDLSSTNGTFVDGERMPDGSSLLVSAGARIGFGAPVGPWELIDAARPEAMAIPLDGGDPARLEGEIIALPSRDDPRATIYRTGQGAWVLERAEEPLLVLRNGKTFGSGGRLWRFCCVELSPSTLACSPPSRPPRLEVGSLKLTFTVSRNEEHVELRATCGDRRMDLGGRAFHYLLLTLARHRLGDAAEGFPETSCGWVHVEELGRDPAMAPPRLNVDVHRIREHFGKHGVLDAAKIIERRQGSRELRIGTGNVSIVTV
jgi:FHA domain